MKTVKFHQYELIDEGDHDDAGAFVIDQQIRDLATQLLADTDAPVIFKGLTVQATGPASSNVEITPGLGFETDGEPLSYDGTQPSASVITVALGGATPGNICSILVRRKAGGYDTDSQSRTFIGAGGATSTAFVNKTNVVGIEATIQEGSAVAAPTPITAGWVKIAEVVAGAAIVAGDIANADAAYSGVDNTGWTNDKQATIRATTYKKHRDTFDHPDGSIDYVHLSTALQALIDESQYDVVIRTQADWESYFGDGTETTPSGAQTAGGWDYTVAAGVTTVEFPASTRVLILPCASGGTTNTFNGNRGYVMKTRCQMQDGSQLIGLGEAQTIVTFDRTTTGETGFEVAHPSAKTVGTAFGSKTVTCADTSGLTVGDYVRINEGYRHPGSPAWESSIQIYRLTAITPTDVTVDKLVHQTNGAASLWRLTPDVALSGFSCDGQAGIGGSTHGSQVYIDDTLFDMKGCVRGVFDAHVLNVHIGDGGGTSADRLYDLDFSGCCRVANIRQSKVEQGFIVGHAHLSIIENIEGCEVTAAAGLVVAYCHGSLIRGIHNIQLVRRCVSRCDEATIDDIRYVECSDTAFNGAAVYWCDWANIGSVRDVKASAGGVGGAIAESDNIRVREVLNCRTHYGGALYDCDNVTVGRILYCYGGLYGGAMHSCNGGTVEAIVACDGNTDGGALYDCDDLKVGYIANCDAGNYGAALYDCDRCTVGRIHNCTTTVDGGALYTCDDCRVEEIYGCTATNGDGGALKSCNRCSVGHIADCTADTNGGALDSCSDCRVDKIRDCTATNGDGGALQGCVRCSVGLVQDCAAPNGNGGCVEGGSNNTFDVIETCTADKGGAGYGTVDSYFNFIRSCASTDATGDSGGALEECDKCTVYGGLWGCTSGGANPAATGAAVLNCDHVVLQGIWYSNADGAGNNYKNVKGCSGGARALAANAAATGASPSTPNYWIREPTGVAAGQDEKTGMAW